MGKFCNLCDTSIQREEIYVWATLALNNDTFTTLREIKNERNPWQARHQSFHLSTCGHLSPRKIINCHISLLINGKKYENCPICRRWSRYTSPCFMWRVTGCSWTSQRSSCCSRMQRRRGPGRVICYSPHMKAPLAVAAWLSARWQRDFNRQSYLSQNKLLQICETNIE